MGNFLKRRIRTNTLRDTWFLMKQENDLWYVYIVECSDKTLYTGITTDVQRRLFEHNNKKIGAKYTRGRRPVKLIASQSVKTRSQALKLEAKIKSLKKKNKVNYLKEWKNYNED